MAYMRVSVRLLIVLVITAACRWLRVLLGERALCQNPS